ncbi:MAG: thymidine phosphorylase [Pyrinomonadaceae bacterium]
MRPQEIISKKRDGERLSREEIEAFISGVTNASWADYQTSALLMAMYLNELNSEEQASITQAMLNSGDVLDFSEIDRPKVDKHSTGGVGDKTSLIIAPVLAACELAVPMISGRGLGHTGGTLDKLESIPGYRVDLNEAEIKSIVKKCGFVMAGQTKNLVPADKKIYALRDATATVSSVPLMVASIMSKKLAEGLDSLVLDVKTGSGAFMKTVVESERLARALIETGTTCGVKTCALITNMNEPLGMYVGNALEVFECLKILRNEAAEAMLPVSIISRELASRLLLSAGVCDSLETARQKFTESIESGRALDLFAKNIELQGGDASVCENPESLFSNELAHFEIPSTKSGVLTGIDTAGIGNFIVSFGGGRTKKEDVIDSRIGCAIHKKIRETVAIGDSLATFFLPKTVKFSVEFAEALFEFDGEFPEFTNVEGQEVIVSPR